MKKSHFAAALLIAGATSAIAQAPAPPANRAGTPRAGAGNRAVRNAPRVNGAITKIEGRVYSVKTLRDATIKVTVPAGTPVQKPGRAPGAIADLKVGTHIAATGERQTPTTFTARRVVIQNPMAAGTIETISATSLTLRLRDGKAATYTVDSKTRWMRNGEAGPWTNFKVGERAVVEYTDKKATTVRLVSPQRNPGQRSPNQRRGARPRRNAPNADRATPAANGPRSGPASGNTTK